MDLFAPRYVTFNFYLSHLLYPLVDIQSQKYFRGKWFDLNIYRANCEKRRTCVVLSVEKSLERHEWWIHLSDLESAHEDRKAAETQKIWQCHYEVSLWKNEMSLVEFIRQSNSVCTKRRSYSEVFHVKKLSVSHAIEYDSFDFSLDSALEINFSFKGKKLGNIKKTTKDRVRMEIFQ